MGGVSRGAGGRTGRRWDERSVDEVMGIVTQGRNRSQEVVFAQFCTDGIIWVVIRLVDRVDCSAGRIMGGLVGVIGEVGGATTRTGKDDD